MKSITSFIFLAVMLTTTGVAAPSPKSQLSLGSTNVTMVGSSTKAGPVICVTLIDQADEGESAGDETDGKGEGEGDDDNDDNDDGDDGDGEGEEGSDLRRDNLALRSNNVAKAGSATKPGQVVCVSFSDLEAGEGEDNEDKGEVDEGEEDGGKDEIDEDGGDGDKTEDQRNDQLKPICCGDRPSQYFQAECKELRTKFPNTCTV